MIKFLENYFASPPLLPVARFLPNATGSTIFGHYVECEVFFKKFFLRLCFAVFG